MLIKGLLLVSVFILLRSYVSQCLLSPLAVFFGAYGCEQVNLWTILLLWLIFSTTLFFLTSYLKQGVSRLVVDYSQLLKTFDYTCTLVGGLLSLLFVVFPDLVHWSFSQDLNTYIFHFIILYLSHFISAFLSSSFTFMHFSLLTLDQIDKREQCNILPCIWQPHNR